MSQIKVSPCPIEGLFIIEPTVHGDDRGFFMETYNKRDLAQHGLNMTFVQDNCSRSARGVLRGLHYQREHPQGKLVRVTMGEVFDVAVDLRPGSKTFGQWHAVVLSQENKLQFYIPQGFAHGFYVLSDLAEFSYKVTDFFCPGDECGIIWNDPQLNIKWPVSGEKPPVLSEKDKNWPRLSEAF